MMEVYTQLRILLNRLWFMLYDKDLNVPNSILCYHEPFHGNIKSERKLKIDLYLWNYNHEIRERAIAKQS